MDSGSRCAFASPGYCYRNLDFWEVPPDQIVAEILSCTTKRYTLYARGEKLKIYRGDDWGRVDSNHRRPKSGDLQSPAIAAMRHPHEMEKVGKFTKFELSIQLIENAGERN